MMQFLKSPIWGCKNWGWGLKNAKGMQTFLSCPLLHNLPQQKKCLQKGSIFNNRCNLLFLSLYFPKKSEPVGPRKQMHSFHFKFPIIFIICIILEGDFEYIWGVIHKMDRLSPKLRVYPQSGGVIHKLEG